MWPKKKMIQLGHNKNVLGGVFLLIAFLIWTDVVGDFQNTGFTGHIALEIAVGLISSFAFCALLYSRASAQSALDQANFRLADNETKAEEFKKEAEKWKKESIVFIEGLSKLIDRQFDDWQFSPSERDVAMLLLKGLSVKEISEVRHTSEKTIRAQSHSVYAKSSLSGRSELAAFFLEDLLAPTRPTP